MNHFEHIEAMHEEIRAYMEKEFPGYKVISIESDAKTEYEPPRSSLVDDPAKLHWLLVNATLRYRVTAEQFPFYARLTCDIYPDASGKFHRDNPTTEIWTGTGR